jgi:hypothetical protein
MTGIFFIFGLITFFKGKMLCGARPGLLRTPTYYVEGEAVKKIGLIICVVDVLPILVIFLMPLIHVNPLIFLIPVAASWVINIILSRAPCFFLDRNDY